MNHIARIIAEREELQMQLRAVRDALTEIEIYLTGRKFTGPDSDYVHVRTDILPKIAAARFLTIDPIAPTVRNAVKARANV